MKYVFLVFTILAMLSCKDDFVGGPELVETQQYVDKYIELNQESSMERNTNITSTENCYTFDDFTGTPEEFEVGTFRGLLNKVKLEDLNLLCSLISQ